MRSSLAVSFFLSLPFHSLVAAAPSVQSPARTVFSGLSRRSNNESLCPAPVDIPTVAKLPSPFTPLSEAELSDVKAWLYDPKQNLNLTSTKSETLSQTDNYIWIIESLYPNKTDVLSYLDGNGPLPPRYARVVINEGGKADPDVSEYYVGPLPVSSETTIQTLDYFYSRSARVPFNARVGDGPRSAAIDEIVTKTMSSIADITFNLTGLQYYGADDERTNAAYFVQSPSSMDGSTSYVWTPWRRAGLAPYDQPSDLYVNFDIGGSDPALYKCRMIVYNLVVYTSVEDFREAFEAGKITQSPPPSSDESFLRKDRKGPIRELENRLAPVSVELDGKRYKVDDENRYVEYLGWSFYTRFDRDVGIQFFDVKYKGERILYELSLQDAVAQYAGNNPFQAGTAYNDRFYGIGIDVGRLIPGYDCPYHATYWNATLTNGESVVNKKNGLCIFESDIGFPVTRHTDSTYTQSTKGSKLTVRQIATVGNYDYLWDYQFFVDGSIAVDARASGYVQANYYRPDDEGKWGPRIQETIAGTLHTHVMNFKADFDLIDANNTFQKTDIIVENITQPWYPELGTFEQMRYNITELANEDSALLELPKNGQSMYTVINKAHTNKWGLPRGYRVIPGLSNVHLASHTNPFFLKNGEAYKQAFAVSRHHDTEPHSSAALNQNLPADPMVAFYDFFDGESLIQEDLAVWFNLGMHHYTRAEDIPNTLMTEAHSSVMFAPQNWGDVEQTVDLTNAVIFNKREGDKKGSVVPETNGANPPKSFPLRDDDQLLGVF
ncbi:copper amine oxidase [Aaosphaeria arxii CBS 175.79]|uniref:Amine oxidase n=1 Tax=Aaosphaeria arxii CBS 175.79 TaxID=1450172 RepID=A0A6A5Y7Q8_9PLEO|nr:copper amine oxidase [Aaosphaeria arxii CBS 175.79]KAF2020584.1 copper amine oxidase [Aaosphaeria arxii CBS 175.79]